jgi:hypothetical protein
MGGDFNDKVGREDISKLTIENESLHEINDDNVVTIVKFSISKTKFSRVQCFRNQVIFH